MNNSLTELPECFFVPASDEGRMKMRMEIERGTGSTYYTIGRSIEGRELEMYKIGNGRGRVAFFGAHHALESITANILYIIIYIISGGVGICFDGVDLPLLRSLFTFYIIPCVNPDGIELRFCGPSCKYMEKRQRGMSGGDYSSWQANARGVDLNHNYDYRFTEYKQLESNRGIHPGRALYSGEYPESEPETRAVASFIRALSPDAVVSLHTQGEEIYHSRDRSGAALASFFSHSTGYSISIPADTAAYGGLCDYTGFLGIPSLTIEIGRGRNPLSQSAIFPALNKIAKPLLLLPTLLI